MTDNYIGPQTTENDIETAPNRDNTLLISEFEDELAEIEFNKNLHVYGRNLSDEEFIDDTQAFKNPTTIRASEMKFNGPQSLKGNEAPAYHPNLNYMRTVSPQRENTSSSIIGKSPTSASIMSSKYAAHVTLDNLKAKNINYEKKLKEMRDRVVKLIEFDEAESLIKVTQLNEKIKFMENILRGVRNDLTYKNKSHNSNEITVRHQKRRFEVPMEKIPSSNIEFCNYQALAYQMKLTDTRKNVATFANVEDFIEKFEALFDSHSWL
ncbi:hypothetical protein [Parasitella parasitica]|uniref:Uncharacterized protein n=1 Tax=Parasitella parasitica TaxID=35722 RepID=A0A0B7NFI7_9FUNG|nr:hypothetical protein [Parasitella parasitica]